VPLFKRFYGKEIRKRTSSPPHDKAGKMINPFPEARAAHVKKGTGKEVIRSKGMRGSCGKRGGPPRKSFRSRMPLERRGHYSDKSMISTKKG